MINRKKGKEIDTIQWWKKTNRKVWYYLKIQPRQGKSHNNKSFSECTINMPKHISRYALHGKRVAYYVEILIPYTSVVVIWVNSKFTIITCHILKWLFVSSKCLHSNETRDVSNKVRPGHSNIKCKGRNTFVHNPWKNGAVYFLHTINPCANMVAK